MYYQYLNIQSNLRFHFGFNIFLAIIVVFLISYSSSLYADTHQAAVIAIDIGHSAKKSGASSARGIGEFQFNQQIAQKLNTQLHAYGFKNSFIINPKGKNIKLKQRTAIAARNYADLFVSIHHDSMQPQFLSQWMYQGKQYRHGEKFKGYSLFISQKTAHKKANTRLAYHLADSLLNQQFIPSLHHAMPIKGEHRRLINRQRGIYAFPELAVLRTAKMPAILVECGVIINKDEELLLSDDAYQQKIAQSLADGIVAYLKNSKKM
jgi:N-acetylmuramoyl-L-alanine amidase